MNIENYQNSGWGLGRQVFENLLEIIRVYDIKRVIEFGSGGSTKFLTDIVSEGIKNLEIVSFDNDIRYAYKGVHTCLTLNIRPLIECVDGSYNKMFEEKKLHSSLLFPKQTKLSTRQHNNFYKILDNDIRGMFDLMILDGSNGNGRNISYLYMKDHLEKDSIVLIDDFTHYDFVEKFGLFFKYKELYKNISGKGDKWNRGGDYIILQILEVIK